MWLLSTAMHARMLQKAEDAVTSERKQAAHGDAAYLNDLHAALRAWNWGPAGVADVPHGAAIPVALAQLHPAEQALAAAKKTRVQGAFIAGRLALRRALRDLGDLGRTAPVTSDARGAPRLPDGTVGSVSHKADVAIALAAPAAQGSIGVDIEARQPPRMTIARRVLTHEEQAAVNAAPDPWLALVVRFSLKESIYKAIAPHVQRYVRFAEASVACAPSRAPRGTARVHLTLDERVVFPVQARYAVLDAHVVTAVRISRAACDALDAARGQRAGGG